MPDGKAILTVWQAPGAPRCFIIRSMRTTQRQHVLRTLAASATVALAALASSSLIAGPAAADPTRAKKGQVFTLACEDLGVVEVATNGNSIWPPTLLTASTQVLVPYAFHLEFTPPGGETQSVDISKPAPKNATVDVCTFGGEDANGSLRGVAYVAVRP